MKITCYRTAAYKNTDTYEVPVIDGNLGPDELTDEDREELQNGAETMCCFCDQEGMMHCVPWSFIIKIED